MPRGLSRVQASAYVGISPTLFEAGAAMNAHTRITDPWPRLMRAETAARYVDERSVQTFRRAVGKMYLRPIKISGKGERWLKDHLDQAINSLFGSAGTIRDIADAL